MLTTAWRYTDTKKKLYICLNPMLPTLLNQMIFQKNNSKKISKLFFYMLATAWR